MTGSSRKHVRIRFKRGDQIALDKLPSAGVAGRVNAVHGWTRAIQILGRMTLWIVGGLTAALIAFGFYLYAFGLQNAYFTETSRKAIQSLAGSDFKVILGNARLSFDKSGHLAFEAKGVSLSGGDGNLSGEMDVVTLALRPSSLIGGNLEVSDVMVSGLNVALPAVGGFALPAQLADDRGRLDPGKVAPTISGGLSRFLGELRSRKLESLVLTNARISKGQTLFIDDFEVRATNETDFAVDAGLEIANQAISLNGTISGSKYQMTIDGLRVGQQVSFDPLLNQDGNTQIIAPNADATLRLSGTIGASPETAQVTVDISRFDYQSRRKARISGSGSISAEFVGGANKIELMPSIFTSGKNLFAFTGAVGPNPNSDSVDSAYRFELVSNNSILMPAESSDPPVTIAFRTAGTFGQTGRNFAFDQVGIRTANGELFGRGTLRIASGSPEIIFVADIPRMQVAEAKHLWPSIFAAGARRWVLANVFGGELRDSNIRVSFAEGAIWPRQNPDAAFLPGPEQVSGEFNVFKTRVDTIGELPPVRDANAKVIVAGVDTTIKFGSGTAYLDNNGTANVEGGSLFIPVTGQSPTIAELDVTVSGEAKSIGDIANRQPINAFAKAPVKPEDLSGNATAVIKAKFPLQRKSAVRTEWNASVDFSNLSISKEIGGQRLSDADGKLSADRNLVAIEAKGKLDGLPASITLKEPLGENTAKRELSAVLQLDDKARNALVPGLQDILKGPIELAVRRQSEGVQEFDVNLAKATLSLPWAGWTKGAGIPAKASFKLVKQGEMARIEALDVRGDSFRFSGNVQLAGKSFSRIVLDRVSLNKNDNFGVSVERVNGAYRVTVDGKSLDLRALLKRATSSFESAAATAGGAEISVKANLDSVTGFNGEILGGLAASYSGVGANIKSFTANATARSGGNIAVENAIRDGQRRVIIQTSDGGAMLRFMDIYDKMAGGRVTVNLVSSEKGVLTGEVDARNFTVVGEPRLKTLAGTPTGPDGKPIGEAKTRIDVSRVTFDRGNAMIEKGKGYLKIRDGILRSAQFGLAYNGTLYDRNGMIDMNGTYLPAYGLNRIFGELPLFGEILGNGRDNGLIGITFRLAGAAKSPKLELNPISLIAPGIFRQIFEFR